MFTSKVFELPLSRDYVRHWGLLEAVRELLQNALDSNSTFEYYLTPGQDGTSTLSIVSRFSRLEPMSLLLGATSKADDHKAIGSFGEGYKIALLVLTRAGYDVRVLNNELLWKPHFRHSNTFGAETLCVEQTKNPEKTQGLVFEVNGLTDQEVLDIRGICLYMQKDIGEIRSTPRGRILLDRPGNLYVGGLFICETGLDYSYDVNPEHIQLERDRQTISGWDLKEITCNMWYATEQYEHIAQMIERNVPDLQYAEYSSPSMVKEACYKIFQEKHPGAIAVTTQKELEDKIKQGFKEVIVVNSTYHANIRRSDGYNANQGVLLKVPPPVEQLQAYFDRNRKYMRTQAIVEMKELIRSAEKWRNQ